MTSHAPVTSLDGLVRAVLEHTAGGPLPKVAIARSAEGHVLQAGVEAFERGVAEPILIGDIDETKRIAEAGNLDISAFRTIEMTDDQQAVDEAVRLFREGEAQFIMKGLVSTAQLLKGVLNKKTGVPNPGSILSHVAAFESPVDGRLMLITDPGVNIAPSMQRKAEILKNSLDVARKLGMTRPKAAILAATEKINYPAMPATLDGDILTKMSRQGEFGDAEVLGPLSLDLAMSREVAACKRFDNPVAGCADILVTPNIEAGNILYKALSTLCGRTMAAVVVGSQVPVVVPSRGDTDASKFHSIALASLLAQRSQ
ncbi:Phosphate butyryltransferase [Pseudodesulfovibrio profundus]|uniref:Phosphate butyryltransferase n=1 Tax=Pseudodesulfovibrio profundus TaxID=57320 RepID=A0A2C8F8W3_9BACT|nr:phosphate acyltransferase [Pseudodesulfovibrio profundus]MBC17528.1 phosphate butyryltransferase [Desulfovibrio sp.]MBC18264.1 phosphate butyryltransferase [Desulfovibrio sp.]SOB58868.1 Phosphate butyryltransferase [Pseudodesulfovibrio profundus]|tara:strand:- start:1715 stop:2656 length:942 start_codon:yes stop_codon:yes gene_type:complete